ncbi:MAG: acyl carrier protein [Eubacteriales bacterium]|nr:acyl carrier protein [Eubacteriales bacterium]
MVFEKLKTILSEQLDIDENSITPDSLLVEDLGADSLDAIDIVMSVEDEFKIEVPDEIIEKIETVGDILNYVENNI